MWGPLTFGSVSPLKAWGVIGCWEDPCSWGKQWSPSNHFVSELGALGHGRLEGGNTGTSPPEIGKKCCRNLSLFSNALFLATDFLFLCSNRYVYIMCIHMYTLYVYICIQIVPFKLYDSLIKDDNNSLSFSHSFGWGKGRGSEDRMQNWYRSYK